MSTFPYFSSIHHAFKAAGGNHSIWFDIPRFSRSHSPKILIHSLDQAAWRMVQTLLIGEDTWISMDKLSPNPWAGQQNERSHVSVLRCQKSEKSMSDDNVTTSLTGHLQSPLETSKIVCVCACISTRKMSTHLIYYIYISYIMSFWQASRKFEVLSFRKAFEPCPSRKNLPPPSVAPVVLWAQGPPTTRVSHQGPSGRWLVNRSTYPYRTPPGETMKPMVN